MSNNKKIQKIKEDRKLEYTTLRRLIVYICKSCSHIFEWIDDRKPNYCPECGARIITTIINSDKVLTNQEELISQIVSISNQGLENE